MLQTGDARFAIYLLATLNNNKKNTYHTRLLLSFKYSDET